MASTSPITIEEWLRLPELPISEDGVEYLVLKVGRLLAPLHEAFDAGIDEPWPTLDADAESIIVLGTITIELAEGPQMFRLPHFLADWAFELVALAHNGVKRFPRWVYFRDDAEEFEVEMLDGPSGTLTVYVDESGNTGDAAKGYGSAFGGQRVFVLVGVADDGRAGSLDDIFANIRSKHGMRATEIKAKRQMDRHEGFVVDVLRSIASNNSVFVEIMDKKFYLAIQVVTFALRTSRFSPFEDNAIANQLADVLTEIVDDDDGTLTAYAEFGANPTRQTFEVFESTFRRSLLRAKLLMGPHQEREFRLLEFMETLFDDAVKERAATDYLSFLQEPDVGPNGKIIPMLPHVQAFSSLLARLNREAPQRRKVRVVHDQQAQFDDVLRDGLQFQLTYRDKLRAAGPDNETFRRHTDWYFTPGRFQLEFMDSKTEAGIQVADIIGRTCMYRMNSVLVGAPPPGGFEEAFEMLHDLGGPGRGVGVNIVATTKMAERFWTPGRGDV